MSVTSGLAFTIRAWARLRARVTGRLRGKLYWIVGSASADGGLLDASQRIIAEFDRLLALDRDKALALPFAQQVLYFVVVARCEADMEGFSSIFEQAMNADELKTLIKGLRTLEEPSLADEFESGLNALSGDGFYEHMNWNRVSDEVKQQIDAIGERVGGELWDLDSKLVRLLDEEARSTASDPVP